MPTAGPLAVAAPDEAPPAIAGVDLYKSFGHVDARRGATIEVKRKSVTALCGDNGAGKSTLLRILCGIHAPDRGDVLIDGVPVLLNSIRDAQARGSTLSTRILPSLPTCLSSRTCTWAMKNSMRDGGVFSGSWRAAPWRHPPIKRFGSSASTFRQCVFRWSCCQAANDRPTPGCSSELLFRDGLVKYQQGASI